jgi:SAM-dependent methyltransferase
MTRVPDDWFVGFHQGLAARFWHAAGEAMADADVRLITTLLARGSVLDVPCGDGRIMRRLAADGYTPTGVDISHELLALADGLDVHHGDLRALPVDGPFDGAISWGNSFGYVTPEDTMRSFAELRRVIRRGGTLVLESGTIAETLLPNGINERSVHEFAGIRMTSTRRYRAAESRYESVTVFEDGTGTVEHGAAAYYVHTAGEVVRMLQAAGFSEVTLRDNEGPYRLGSSRMIAVAR